LAMNLGSVHPLRRHMVRRVPTREDLSRRTPLVLTSRDKLILDAIHTHGFLTTALIELAFFPPPPTGRTSTCTRVYTRLDRLWRAGYVDRVELPVSRVLGGRRPYLYSLGERGVPAVSALQPLGAPPVHRRRLDRMVDVFVDHELLVARLWADVASALRGTGARWFWESERQLRRRGLRVKPEGSKWWLPVLPDAYLRVDSPDGAVQCVLVEVDCGTLTLARFRKKLRAFELCLETGQFRDEWGQGDFEVAVLTHSAARLQSLRRAAREEVPQERWHRYLFATFDMLEPDRFLGPHWLTLEEDVAPERLLRMATPTPAPTRGGDR
jgi:DNA-binding MarR family transcriptional regulator